MNILKRNLIIGLITSVGVIGASDANAFDWSEGPQIIGIIVGGGIGSAIGSISTNPFIAGATGAAGGVVGGKVGPYVADNPKTSAEVFNFVISGPTGMVSTSYKTGAIAAINFVKNLFW